MGGQRETEREVVPNRGGTSPKISDFRSMPKDLTVEKEQNKFLTLVTTLMRQMRALMRRLKAQKVKTLVGGGSEQTISPCRCNAFGKFDSNFCHVECIFAIWRGQKSHLGGWIFQWPVFRPPGVAAWPFASRATRSRRLLAKSQKSQNWSRASLQGVGLESSKYPITMSR